MWWLINFSCVQKVIVTLQNMLSAPGFALSAGTSAIILNCASASRTVGLGAGSGQLGLTGTELQLITATGMTIGGGQCGSQTLGGISATHSNGISQMLTLLASRNDATVTFSGSDSVFNAVAAQADKALPYKRNKK